MHQRALVQCCSRRCAHPPSPFVSHKMTMHLSTPSCSERVGHGAHISVCVFLVRTAISHFIRPFHCSPLWLWFLRALGDCCGGMWVVLLLQMYGILPGATTVPLPACSPLLAAMRVPPGASVVPLRSLPLLHCIWHTSVQAKLRCLHPFLIRPELPGPRAHGLCAALEPKQLQACLMDRSAVGVTRSQLRAPQPCECTA